MLEIEQKFAAADFSAIEQRLREWSARQGAEHDEADHYFNAPDRDFARTVFGVIGCVASKLDCRIGDTNAK